MQKIKVVKSKAEIGLMKIAADISAEGHARVSRWML
jgi:Xaa-Pro aminopeptidase